MNHEKKKYIDGIFNYCDRWCEKCKFTSNCRLFSTESKIYTYEIMNDGKLPNADDIINFNIDTSENANNNFDDFDLNEEDAFDIEVEEDDLIDRIKENKEYEIEKLADKYFNKAYSFIKSLDNKFNFAESVNQKKKEPGFQILFDNIEIVSWYHMFIMVKIKRAVGGKKKLKIGMDEFENEISNYDMNGSAKIAAIAVKESQKALNILLSHLKDYSSEIEEMMILLGKILNQLDVEFPDYKNFERPGFDTGA
ncbi:MAG: hypothetical protein IIB83_07820 [Bacteroidetes bacterium]|nr:hypothetical protein [Bacteroidota bacterium]